MNEGDAGSDTSDAVEVEAPNGGWIESPFMFRGLLGDGEVIGRSVCGGGLEMVRAASDGKPPNVVAGKDDRGIRFMGESGEEEGDGSDSGDESDVDGVVVGDESADSDAWVEVLS